MTPVSIVVCTRSYFRPGDKSVAPTTITSYSIIVDGKEKNCNKSGGALGSVRRHIEKWVEHMYPLFDRSKIYYDSCEVSRLKDLHC